MAGKYLSDDDSIAEINVVPLVDIILVVLIIFMVTAPMIARQSLNVTLPKSQSGEAAGGAVNPLAIAINSEGVLYLNNQPATLESIRSIAAQALSQNPEAQAVITADEKVSHGLVVSVIDTIKSVGIVKFAILTQKK